MIDWTIRYLSHRPSTEAIILHHTETGRAATVEAIDRDHRQRVARVNPDGSVVHWTGIGYQFLVRLHPRDGWEVCEGRPEWACGAHAPGWNARSIAIAIAGSYADSRPPPEEAVDLVTGLCVSLRSRYGPLRILGHREAMAEVGEPNHTDCPGTLSWVETIRERLPADGPA